MRKKFKNGTKVKINQNCLSTLNTYMLTSWPYHSEGQTCLELKNGTIGEVVAPTHNRFQGYYSVRIPVINGISFRIDLEEKELTKVAQ